MTGALPQIVLLTLHPSGLALLIAAGLGVPAGAWVGLHRFPGRGLVSALLYTGMGLPPRPEGTRVGLVVYLLLSRQGPLGGWGWLFTPEAMILAQAMIAFPVVAALTAAAVQGVDPELRIQLRSLGALPWQESLLVLRQAWPGIIAALAAGFGSIISEVGAVMLVGGNVAGQTRVLTTAIVLETRRGNFAATVPPGGCPGSEAYFQLIAARVDWWQHCPGF